MTFTSFVGCVVISCLWIIYWNRPRALVSGIRTWFLRVYAAIINRTVPCLRVSHSTGISCNFRVGGLLVLLHVLCVSLGATWQTWSLERWSVTYSAVPPGGCLALCRFELQVGKAVMVSLFFWSQYDTFPKSCLALKMMGKQNLQIARFVDCRMIHMQMLQVVIWEESNGLIILFEGRPWFVGPKKLMEPLPFPTDCWEGLTYSGMAEIRRPCELVGWLGILGTFSRLKWRFGTNMLGLSFLKLQWIIHFQYQLIYSISKFPLPIVNAWNISICDFCSIAIHAQLAKCTRNVSLIQLRFHFIPFSFAGQPRLHFIPPLVPFFGLLWGAFFQLIWGLIWIAFDLKIW